MIDWTKYDPIKDANEEESHLCNSLNAEFGFIKHLIADPNLTGVNYVPIAKTDLERLADYGFRAQAVITYLQDKLFFQDQKAKKKIRIRAVLDIPVTDEELYDLCVRSNGEGELDQIGCGYSEVQLPPDQVKDYLARDWVPSTDPNDQSWISDEDLEEFDKWFLEKKKEKYGRYDRDPLKGEQT